MKNCELSNKKIYIGNVDAGSIIMLVVKFGNLKIKKLLLLLMQQWVYQLHCHWISNADPKKQIIAVTGDGSIELNIQET